MIRCMSRRVNRAQGDRTKIHALAVLQHEIRFEGCILARGRRPAEHLRPRCGLDRGRGRRMILVRVRAEDPFDVAEREDLLDVRGDVGPRIEHCALSVGFTAADDVGVGPGAGHHAGIRRDEPRHPAIEALGLAGDQIVGRRAGLLRVAPVDLVVLRVDAAEHLLAFPAEGEAGAVLLDLLQRAHVAQRLAGAREVLELAQDLASRVHQLDLAARGTLERFARRDPDVVHRFGGVVRGELALGRHRDEKARVEAPRAAGRRDPVAAIGELGRRQIEVLLLQKLGERPAAVMGERRGALGRDELPLRVAGEQHACFLEAFADRGDPIGDRRRRHEKAPHARHDPAVVVGGLERAAREHVSAAEERRVLRSLQHQYLRSAARIAQERERRRRARDHGGHQCTIRRTISAAGSTESMRSTASPAKMSAVSKSLRSTAA